LERDAAESAYQRDDVAADRQAVLLIGPDLNPSLLGRQPHRLEELAHPVRLTAGPAAGASF
jgi:hypothetical protein